MSIKADALSDEIAKMLSEYETEIVKTQMLAEKSLQMPPRKSCGRPAPKEQANMQKLGRDKRSGRIRRKREVYRSQQKAVSADTSSGAWACDGKRQAYESNSAHQAC